MRVLTAVCLAVAAALIVWGLTHESSDPALLGRYSAGYAALLAALLGAVVFFALVLWRPAPRLRRVAGNLYALGFGVVASLVLAEGALRTLNPWGVELFHWLPYHMQGMIDDPVLGYAHPSSTEYRLGDKRVALNGHGLRDRELGYEKPAGEKRLLVLGDSVAFGWGVDQEETVSARLEERLAGRVDARWEAINAGVNGYNTEQQALYFRTRGLRYRPDLVVLIYVGNDVEPRLDPNVVTWRRYPEWPGSLPEALDRIKSLSLLYQSTRMFLQMSAKGGAAEGAAGGRKSLVEHPGWPTSFAALADLARRCEAAGIPFLVAFSSGADEAVLAELDAEGIEAVTLKAAWERVPPERRHVSRVDPHPSPEVHDAFAQALLRELSERGWLEDTPADASRSRSPEIGFDGPGLGPRWLAERLVNGQRRQAVTWP